MRWAKGGHAEGKSRIADELGRREKIHGRFLVGVPGGVRARPFARQPQ